MWISDFGFRICELWIGVALSLLLGCGTSPLVIPEPGSLAPDFTLMDQYDQKIRLSQFRGKYVLLLGCGQQSIGQGETWLDLLMDGYPEGLQILPIANGSGLSFFVRLFLKGKIKAALREEEEGSNSPSILLDWDGEVSRQYGMPPDGCTAVLIDPAGRIRWVHPLGEITAEELGRISDRIDSSLP